MNSDTGKSFAGLLVLSGSLVNTIYAKNVGIWLTGQL